MRSGRNLAGHCLAEEQGRESLAIQLNDHLPLLDIGGGITANGEARSHAHHCIGIDGGKKQNRPPPAGDSRFDVQELGAEAYSLTLSTEIVSPFSLPVTVTFLPAESKTFAWSANL